MPVIDAEVETKVSQSVRARQLSGMFDVPAQEAHHLSWHIEAPWEEREWNIGLITGPSGAGKTTILREVFGEPVSFRWNAASVIDAFGKKHSVEEISRACSAVGFNTIPAWLRPYSVLSSGERFRVELARAMLDSPPGAVAIDEFSSVVDRQVAQIGSHAIQKWVRREGRQLVAATCHYDVIEWLQPDWTLDVSERRFDWRSVQPRPRLDVEIRSVDYSLWSLFAPFHYLTAKLNRTARCFVAFVNGEPASFAGVLYRPHPKTKNIEGVSRLVTLPDWQGLGLAFVLVDALGAVLRRAGRRLRTYPAHPALIRGFDTSPRWVLRQTPGRQAGWHTGALSWTQVEGKSMSDWHHGSRPCAVFEYVGDPWVDRDEALEFLRERGGRLDDVWDRVAR